MTEKIIKVLKSWAEIAFAMMKMADIDSEMTEILHLYLEFARNLLAKNKPET